jgi:hypothetical protein
MTLCPVPPYKWAKFRTESVTGSPGRTTLCPVPPHKWAEFRTESVTGSPGRPGNFLPHMKGGATVAYVSGPG